MSDLLGGYLVLGPLLLAYAFVVVRVYERVSKWTNGMDVRRDLRPEFAAGSPELRREIARIVEATREAAASEIKRHQKFVSAYSESTVDESPKRQAAEYVAGLTADGFPLDYENFHKWRQLPAFRAFTDLHAAAMGRSFDYGEYPNPLRRGGRPWVGIVVKPLLLACLASPAALLVPLLS